MSRFLVPAKVIKRAVEAALAKRYGAELDDFLFCVENGIAETKYPGSEDLVELTKYL